MKRNLISFYIEVSEKNKKTQPIYMFFYQIYISSLS